MCREFLCLSKALPCPGTILDHSPLALPSVHRSYELMRQTYYFCSPRLVHLVCSVFAGCRKPLLLIGPSQHYLCNPCKVVCVPTPPQHSDAFTRFFSECFGLAIEISCSTCGYFSAKQFQQRNDYGAATISLCSNLLTCSTFRLHLP
jgi:hypothetical protein